MRYYTRIIRAIAVVFFALTVCPFSPAATNTVSREIRYENGDVWVEDKMHLTLGIWKTTLVLQDIHKEKESGKTNLMDDLRNLLKGEDLEVTRYHAEVKGEFMDLHIRSKVKSEFHKPARLRFLANYGGYKYTLTSSGEKSEPYMLVYAGNGGQLLWLPEWDPPADLAKIVVESINVTYAMRQWLKIEPTDVLSLRCFIKTGEKEEALFEASPWKEAPNTPDAEFLSRLHRSHKMSGNDWNRIFTDFKLAKSGYYVIDVSGFTNRPPILPPGEIEDTKRAIAPSSPDEFKARITGTPKRIFPKTKYLIDGSFNDWKQYTTAWSGEVADQPEVIVGGRNIVRGDNANQSRVVTDDLPSERFFHTTECYYTSDENYFYVFLKFKPSVQERYDALNFKEKSGVIGSVGSLYIDRDSNSKTGAQEPSVKPQLVGMDLMFFVSAEAAVQAGTKRSSAQVSYQISTWDAASGEFGLTEQRLSSNSATPFINHGKDGIEMAILLSDIRKVKGEMFELVYRDEIPFSPFHRVTVRIE